jgi:arginyl-tRNA synthetase
MVRRPAYMTSMRSPTGPGPRRRYSGAVSPHPLSVAVVRALDVLVDEGAVSWRGAVPDADAVDDVRVSRDGTGYATSLALRLSGRAGIPADRLAGLLAGRLAHLPGVATASVSGPGYVEVEPDLAVLVEAAFAVPADDGGARAALDPLPRGRLDPALGRAVAELGADAVRFALARRTTTAAPTAAAVETLLDAAVWGRADDRNPVHAVQLAHARLVGVLRHGAALGVAVASRDEVLLGELDTPTARGLVAAVADASVLQPRAVRLRRPDLVTRHLSATADAVHRHLSWGAVVPSGDEEPHDGHPTRLRLAAAARDSLARGLDLLGVTAPERM